jgi:hypothetical protein
LLRLPLLGLALLRSLTLLGSLALLRRLDQRVLARDLLLMSLAPSARRPGRHRWIARRICPPASPGLTLWQILPITQPCWLTASSSWNRPLLRHGSHPVQTHAHWFRGKRRGCCTVPAVHSVSVRPLGRFCGTKFLQAILGNTARLVQCKKMSDFTLGRSSHHPRSVSIRSAQKKELSAAAELFRLGRGYAAMKKPNIPGAAIAAFTTKLKVEGG